MNIKKISIIVPVYNVEQYLDECIKSILKQSYKNFELILINDGSNDNSGKICDYFASIDKRIRVIHTNNQGVSASRNKGIRYSNGDYIMFCDSDDWIEYNLIESLYENIQSSNSDIIFSGLYRDIYVGEEKIKNLSYGISDEIIVNMKEFHKYLRYVMETLKGAFSSPCAKLYNAKIIKDKKLYFNENMVCHEDLDFNLRFIQNSNKLHFTKDIKYHYRGIRGNEGLERRKKNDLVYEISTTYYQMNKLLLDMDCNKSLRYYIEDWFLDNYNLVLKKIIKEEKNITRKEINGILEHLYNDKEFCDFITFNKDRIRIHRYIKYLINIKLYGIAYYVIRKRIV